MKEPEPSQVKCFSSESDARAFARKYLHDVEVVIIHSPHRDNKAGADYFVDDEAYAFVRYWEREVFSGLGARA